MSAGVQFLSPAIATMRCATSRTATFVSLDVPRRRSNAASAPMARAKEMTPFACSIWALVAAAARIDVVAVSLA